MSRVIRKYAFCIGKKKGLDQLRGYPAPDQHLYFHYIFIRSHNTSTVNSKYENKQNHSMAIIHVTVMNENMNKI